MVHSIAGSVFLSLLVFGFALFVFWWGVIRHRHREGRSFTSKMDRREFRRTLISALMIIVAVLIFLSVATIPSIKEKPEIWAYYMLAIFILLIGIIILAIFDSLESLRNLIVHLSSTRPDPQNKFRIQEEDLQKFGIYPGSNNGKGHIRIDKEV
ncbi:hypothetical protein JXQ70_06975 [bacterium]|nr:hypothetical protein [bacterium]